MAADKICLPLVSGEKISEITTSKTAATKNVARATKWIVAWAESVVKPETLMY